MTEYLFSGGDHSEKLGRVLTREEFVKLDPGLVFDCLTNGGTDGVDAILFERSDGRVGAETNFYGCVA